MSTIMIFDRCPWLYILLQFISLYLTFYGGKRLDFFTKYFNNQRLCILLKSHNSCATKSLKTCCVDPLRERTGPKRLSRANLGLYLYLLVLLEGFTGGYSRLFIDALKKQGSQIITTHTQIPDFVQKNS